MTGTKKQHYVPQCLLRHFASKDRVAVFDSARGKWRINRHIKEEFAENYLYDTDNAIEDLLGKVEDSAAPYIAEYVAGNLATNSKVPPQVARFVAVQVARTLGTRSEIVTIFDKFSRQLVRQIGERNGVPTEGVIVKLNDPNVQMRQQALGACVSLWWLLLDLNAKLLINRTATPFILSDHPVVHYNWYMKDSKDPANTSLAAVGLQMFIPLSSETTLCLYDAKVYKVGDRYSGLVDVLKPLDVELLNSLQAMNRDSLLLVGNPALEDYVRGLCARHGRMSLHLTESAASEPIEHRGKSASTVAVWRTQRHIRTWLSVVGIRRDASRARGEYRERRPDIVRLVASFNDLLRKDHQEPNASQPGVA